MEEPQRTGADSDVCDEKCSICLAAFEDQSVGSLENCPHEFCLQCIVQWSKTVNSCPVDRTTFTVIHQRRRRGGVVHRKIRVSAPQCVDEDEEEQGSAVICEKCGRSDGRSRMLLCSHCDSGFHMKCLRPAVSERPQGPWVCPECDVSLHPPDSFAAEEGISDGELDDILSEADETSSRLRPSTLNRGGSRPTAHRVQTRSRREPAAPQVVTRVPKSLLLATNVNSHTDDAADARASSSDDAEPRKRRKSSTQKV